MSIIVFVFLHESIHFIAFKLQNIEFKTKIVWRKHLPIAYYVYSDYFDKPFYLMSKQKQKQYFFIAILPYFVVFPIAFSMTTYDNIQMSIIGLTMIVTHLVNLPLEFVHV